MRILFIMSAFSLAQVSAAKAFSDKWFACRRMSECTKVHVGCGRAGGVAKKFEKEHAQLVEKLGETSSCLEPSKESLDSDKTAIPDCIKGRCEIVAPKDTHKSENK